MTPIEERFCQAFVIVIVALWIAAVYVMTM